MIPPGATLGVLGGGQLGAMFAMAARPEIQRIPRMRRLHVAAAVLTAVLLAVAAITGSRDLLQMSVAS